MPEFSISEFASLINVEPKQVHTLVSRKKIIKNERRKIDTSIDINKYFLEQRQAEIIPTKSKSKRKVKPSSNDAKEIPPISKHALVLEEKTKVELQIKKRELEAKELELSRKRGELVNLEQTGDLISKYVHSTNNKLCESIQIFVRDICARHSIEISKAGAYELKVKGMINKINEDSVNEIFKSLENE